MFLLLVLTVVSAVCAWLSQMRFVFGHVLCRSSERLIVVVVWGVNGRQCLVLSHGVRAGFPGSCRE